MGGYGHKPSYFEKVYFRLQKSDKNDYISLNINETLLGGLGLDQVPQERHGSDSFLLPLVGGGPGVLSGAPALADAVPPFPCGAEGLYAAHRRHGPRWCAARGGCWDHLQVGVRVPVLLGGVPVTALGSQRSDDLVRCVEQRRSGACIARGCGLRHCCVAVPESRDVVRCFPGLPVPVVVRVMAHVVGVGGVGVDVWHRC